MMFSCLYTKHKTQKRKVWMDGRLVVRGASAVLHRAEPPIGGSDLPIDACEIATAASPGQLGAPGQLLEMEGHLVTIEGPWTGRATGEGVGGQLPPKVPQKALPKFRKPPTRAPPPPLSASAPPPQLANRKRPLQPGELQIQYYGASDNNRNGGMTTGHYNPEPMTDGVASNVGWIQNRQPLAHHHHHQPPIQPQVPVSRNSGSRDHRLSAAAASGGFPASNPHSAAPCNGTSVPPIPGQRPSPQYHPPPAPPALPYGIPAMTGAPTAEGWPSAPTPDHPRDPRMPRSYPPPQSHPPPSVRPGFLPQTNPGGTVPGESLLASWDRTKENRGGNHRRRPQACGGLFSSSNGFDPTLFYGDDDDEGSAEEESDNDEGYTLGPPSGTGGSQREEDCRATGVSQREEDRRARPWLIGGQRSASPSSRGPPGSTESVAPPMPMPPLDDRSGRGAMRQESHLSFSAAPPTLSEQRLLDLFRDDSPPPPAATAAAPPALRPSAGDANTPGAPASSPGATPSEEADDFVLPEQENDDDEDSSFSSSGDRE